MAWEKEREIVSKQYDCGHCGNSLVSNKGYTGTVKGSNAWIYVCHYCGQPTYFGPGNTQFPGAAFGRAVASIPSEEVKSLYDEARNCMKVNAFTASVLCCRKLLMNIAVSKDADEGLRFIEYVEFLSEKGYVPPDGKHWVDHIRDKGNEATHEIKVMQPEDAKDLITFIEMLLKFIYEFPAKVKKPEPTPS